MRKSLVVSFLIFSLPLTAWAADRHDKFAAKGAAGISCAAFVEEREKHSQTYSEAMAWLTGFVSAYNQIKPETYDVVPWQSAELLSKLLASHCGHHPDETFLFATNRLLNSLAEDRLRTASEIVTVTVGDNEMKMYKDIVFRVQSALKDKGYLKTRWGTGDYDDATIAAMKSFQAANNLEATGIPDQQSLFMLFSR